MAKRGTSPKKSSYVGAFLSEEEQQALDDWRFERRIGSRSEAIRQLLQLGLEASKQRAAEGPGTAGRPSP